MKNKRDSEYYKGVEIKKNLDGYWYIVNEEMQKVTNMPFAMPLEVIKKQIDIFIF